MSFISRLTAHYIFQGYYQGILLAVFALFLRDKGMVLSHIGYAYGTFSICSVLMELPLGLLADSQGRIKLFRWSLWLTALSLPLAVFSQQLLITLLAMAMLGIARALESGSINAWEIEQIRENGLNDKIASLLARFQASNAAGSAMGAITGGYLPTLYNQLSPSGSVQPSAFNLLAVSALSLIHILLLKFIFKEGDSKPARNDTQNITIVMFNFLKSSFKTPKLRALLLIYFCFGLLMGNVEAYWQPFVASLNDQVNYSLFGWLTFGYLASASVGPTIFSRITGNKESKYHLCIALTLSLSGIALFLMALAKNSTSFIGPFFLFTASIVSIHVPLKILLNKLVHDRHRSAILSLSSLAIQFGAAVSAFGLSHVIQEWGISKGWLLLSTMLLAGSFLKLFRNRKQSSKTETPLLTTKHTNFEK